MIGDQTYREPITVVALLMALSVLVVTQIAATVYFLVLFYGLSDAHLDGMFILLSGIYGLKDALFASAGAFVIALGVCAIIEAVRRFETTNR